MVMRKCGTGILRIIDSVFLTRPILIIPVWGFSVFGYCAGLRRLQCYSLASAWHTMPVVASWMFIFSLSVGAVYALNQIMDKKVDSQNEGFALLVKGGIPVRWAWLSFAGCAAISVFMPFYSYPVLGFFSLAALILGLLYSCKPMRFSGRPWLDFLTNATGYGFVSFGAGWFLTGAELDMHFLCSALPYFLLMCTGSISSTLPDFDGDSTCGKRTTAVILGKHNAHILATVILGIALVLSIIQHDLIAFACAAFSFPLYVIYVFYQKDVFMEATYKIGCLICIVVASIAFPYIGAATAAAVLLTIAYFRFRHRVLYPSLLPVSSKIPQP
jgi:4-hydroxybenzoate polyprenyltransferase